MELTCGWCNSQLDEEESTCPFCGAYQEIYGVWPRNENLSHYSYDYLEEEDWDELISKDAERSWRRGLWQRKASQKM